MAIHDRDRSILYAKRRSMSVSFCVVKLAAVIVFASNIAGSQLPICLVTLRKRPPSAFGYYVILLFGAKVNTASHLFSTMIQQAAVRLRKQLAATGPCRFILHAWIAPLDHIIVGSHIKLSQ